ncbi:MAG: dihydropteroate synthase [Planctomycetes bacterium]|nr:dihydropteroate synthase [Planctomycetota bacterium]MCW8134579.1 dihydropteroate synthase [Planctomycetota bacterium]
MSLPEHFYRTPTAALAEPWPMLMGIVNVTPDSFSDGGSFVDRDAAVTHALQLVREGADVLDIGGESTRPGALPVSASEEIARVVPVIRALRGRVNTPISIDTMKAEVAQAALDAGADIVNDVSAGTDPAMFALCARRGCLLVLMHMKGTPRTMQSDPEYGDVLREVAAHLQDRVSAATAAGIPRNHLWIDPGFGFGKLPAHNVALVRRLPELAALGLPLLLGVSRKSTLGALTGAPVHDREPESLAAGLVGAMQGAAVLRVHEVGPMKRALLVARAMLARGDG